MQNVDFKQSVKIAPYLIVQFIKIRLVCKLFYIILARLKKSSLICTDF